MTSHHPCPPGRPGQGLALIGYRGTGKSTVGRILADRLNRKFLDADLEIEARAGRSIRSIFTEWGEAVFRDWEEQTLAELTSAFPDAIVATGGGVVLREINRHRIRGLGFVVWLRADASVAGAPAGIRQSRTCGQARVDAGRDPRRDRHGP